MPVWAENDDPFAYEDPSSPKAVSAYLPALQNIPTIASSEESDSDDEAEPIIFSNVFRASNSLENVTDTAFQVNQEGPAPAVASTTSLSVAESCPPPAKPPVRYGSPQQDTVTPCSDTHSLRHPQPAANHSLPDSIASSSSSWVRLAGPAGQLAAQRLDRQHEQRHSCGTEAPGEAEQQSWPCKWSYYHCPRLAVAVFSGRHSKHMVLYVHQAITNFADARHKAHASWLGKQRSRASPSATRVKQPAARGLDQRHTTDSNSPQEADLEEAFQRAVQQDDGAALRPLDTCLNLDTAVQQLDIDNLLKKLICGNLQYNPHDPHSGLPSAGSLYTESEAGSTALGNSMLLEEQLQHNDAEWSQLDARRSLQSSVCLPIGGSTQDCQAHMKPSSAGNVQHTALKYEDMGVHSNKAGAVQPTLRVHTESGKPNVQTAIQDIKHPGAMLAETPVVSVEQLNSIPFRHRQTSRLANRFREQADRDIENDIEEEFVNLHRQRAAMKNTSLCS